MARFAFVVPPLVGHVNPTVSVGAALAARGHEVAWVGHSTVVRPLLPPDARLLALDEEVFREQFEPMLANGQSARGPAALKFLLEEFMVPLARGMLAGVDAAMEELAPDVVIADQQTLAGAFVARRRGIRWATSASTSAAVVEPLTLFPKVRAWYQAVIADFEREVGLEPIPDPDRSPMLVLVFSTRAFVGAEVDFPPHYAFVGPAIRSRPVLVEFPWEALAPGPRVLVSLGTVNARRGARFYRAVAEAFAGAPWQAILAAPADVAGAQPPNVLRRDYVPQLELLAEHVDAVVTHGGHNTVCEALLHGRPLVVAPIKDDQPVIAGQVVSAGAGLRLPFGRVTGAELGDAVRRVLEEPAFAEAARRIGEGFRAAGGAEAAADHLEALAAT